MNKYITSCAAVAMTMLIGMSPANADEFEITAPPAPICADGAFLWVQEFDVDVVDRRGIPVAITTRLVANGTQVYTIPGAYPDEFGSAVTLSVTDAVAWDGYTNRTDFRGDVVGPGREGTGEQPNERFRLVFLNGGVEVDRTDWTGDGLVGTEIAPNDDDGINTGWISDFWQGPLGPDIVLPDGTDEIRLVHWSADVADGGTGESGQNANRNSVIPTSVCISAGEELLGSLGDFVWEDLDADGNQDCPTGTEPECDTGIPNVRVELLTPGSDGLCDTGDEVFLAEDFTDATGFYLFDNLGAGDYCVKFDKSSAEALCDIEIGGEVAFSPETGVLNDPDNSDADTVSGSSSIIALGEGETNLKIDAGLYCPAKLGDRVWIDVNRDGIQDSGEVGINDVTVNLHTCDIDTGNVVFPRISSQVTATMDGEDGIYMFNPLPPGDYAVAFILPDDFVFSPADQGIDDAMDSDANTVTGFGMCMPLESNQNDPTKDAGLNEPPLSGLGDRLWEDKDADGLQETGEEGIPDATVNLLTPGADGECDSGDEVFMATTTTAGDGLYEFLDLVEGRYCVEFVINNLEICLLGDLTPRFTTQNSASAADDVDSDANPLTGQTGNIDLGEEEFDPTNDAGVYCPAKLGDRVWKDENSDGIQDSGEEGVNGVVANLYACDDDDNPINGSIGTTTTALMDGENGIYMFNNLDPGNYAVQFTEPTNLVFTLPNEGTDDAVDSDADTASGFTDCMPLESNENNPTKDAGLVDPPDCGLGIVKSCEVMIPPPPPLQDCDGKLQSFTLIWNGSGDINVSGIPNDAPGGDVSSGDEVTFSGPFSENDNFLTISGAANGESVFHVSCSDEDMDGETDNAAFPGDCGKAEGNGKNDDGGFINDWLLEGLTDDDGEVVDCTIDPPTPSSSCEFSATTASCDTLPEKPTTFGFQYSGGGCGASNDSQGDKSSCEGSIDGSLPVDVTTSTGEFFTVNPGETFTIAKDGSNTTVTLSNSGGIETIDFHTSCSAPLITGEIFGSLTLTSLDGVGSGRDVLYSYEIENMGQDLISNISVTDDKLGLIGSGLSLNPGDSDSLTAMSFITETTINTATATGDVVTEVECTASATATVTVTAPPACTVSVAFKELKDDAIKYTLTNTGNGVATLDDLTLDFPSVHLSIREVKLDGTIYKSKDSSLFVGPGDTIGSGDWTESDVSKRQLDPGEKDTLEIKFSRKTSSHSQNEFDGTVNFKEGCMVIL